MIIRITTYQIEDYAYIAFSDCGCFAFGYTEASVVSNICTQLEKLFGVDICATQA